jgi:GAF domain-containing protein
MGWVKLQDVNFLSLPTAIFCVACELISENNTPSCLACGSRAVLQLSRVLGGSLRGQQTAHLIADAELDLLVRDLLRTVPARDALPERHTPDRLPVRSHVRAAAPMPVWTGISAEIQSGDLDLEPTISVIAERAQSLTRATGAAIALNRGADIVCRARTGRTAPDLGARLQTNSGISAECVRTGEVVLCHDAERHPLVDRSISRHLGVRSILAAPLRYFRRTVGVFEVLSSSPHAFGECDIVTMQLLSSTMVAAISRLSALRQQRRSA